MYAQSNLLLSAHAFHDVCRSAEAAKLDDFGARGIRTESKIVCRFNKLLKQTNETNKKLNEQQLNLQIKVSVQSNELKQNATSSKCKPVSVKVRFVCEFLPMEGRENERTSLSHTSSSKNASSTVVVHLLLQVVAVATAKHKTHSNNTKTQCSLCFSRFAKRSVAAVERGRLFLHDSLETNRAVAARCLL
jgi:hypothetical protein